MGVHGVRRPRGMRVRGGVHGGGPPEEHPHQVSPRNPGKPGKGAVEALLLRDDPEELGKRGATPAHPFFAGGGSIASGAQMMRWHDGQTSVSSVVFRVL